MAHHAIHSEWPVYKYIYKQATLNQSDYTANIHPNKCGGTVAQHIVLARHTCHSPVDPRAAVLKWSTAEHRWKGSGSGGAREGLDFLALDVCGSMFGREKISLFVVAAGDSKTTMYPSQQPIANWQEGAGSLRDRRSCCSKFESGCTLEVVHLRR